MKWNVEHAKGTLAVRPDSGSPPEVVLECLNILGDKFGITVNQKGYKVLNPHVRLIQGDGVDYIGMRDILVKIEEAGWSADNVAFGMGGGLLQKHDHDTQKFAFKCSSITRNEQIIPVFKCPVTDRGKTSKKGYQSLVQENGTYRTIDEKDATGDLLRIVYNNGVVSFESFSDIRKRAAIE